jgi:hypothetical protein
MILELQLDPARELAAIQNYANVKARLYPKPPPQVRVPLSATVARPKGPERYASTIGPRSPATRPLQAVPPGDRRVARTIDTVARCNGLKAEHLYGVKREPRIVHARQIAMYAVHVGLGVSSSSTARAFMRLDGSCVLHAVWNVRAMIEQGKLDDPLPRLFPDRVAV